MAPPLIETSVPSPTAAAGRTVARHGRYGPGLARQRGVALYLLVVAAAITLTALLLGGTATVDPLRARADDDARVLADAKRLLLAHLANPDLDLPAAGRRLGEPGLTPDLPIASGAGADASEPNYDGNGETSGCAWRGWVPGATLRSPDVAGAAARCFGRFPWKGLKLALPDADPQDPAGRVPWLVLSPNLSSRLYLRDLTPSTLSKPWTGYGAPNRPPYPWLVVRDARGNLISDRVAAVLVMPGPALPGQVRSAAAGPSAWLDRLVVAPGCPQPCRPGSYDNAGYNQPDNMPVTLINGPRTTSAALRAGVYAQPPEFNDHLAWITVDELLATLEKRARTALTGTLARFRSTNGYFPYAAPFDAVNNDCSAGLRFGHPATGTGSCSLAATLPTWFADAGWQRYFVYAVSARCVEANHPCGAPGLVVNLAAGGAIGDVDALTITPGAPIVTAPFAAARGAPQVPQSGLALSADPRDWLDDPTSASAAGATFTQTEGALVPANDRLEIIR